MAAAEALVDFPDDDLPTDLIISNQQSLTDLRKRVGQILERSEAAQVWILG